MPCGITDVFYCKNHYCKTNCKNISHVSIRKPLFFHSYRQDGFINFIVKPLFEALVTILPGAHPLILGIEANGRYGERVGVGKDASVIVGY